LVTLVDQIEEIEVVPAIIEGQVAAVVETQVAAAFELPVTADVEVPVASLPSIDSAAAVALDIELEPELVRPKSVLVYSATDIQNSEDWISIFQQLLLEGMLKSICGQLSFRQRDADFLIFDIDQAASGVLSDKYQSKFCELLSEHLGKPLQISIESQNNHNESPTRRAERLHQEALENAEKDLLGSEAAQKLTETFNARLVAGSISLK